MAKMDKDGLKKQKFWIALGAFVLLWLIGLVTLQTSAGGPIEAKKQEIDKAQKGIEGWTSKVKNRATFVPPWEKYGKTYRDHKNTIWQEAWNAQKTLLKWPVGGPYAAMWERSPSFEEWKKAMEDETDGRSTTLRDEYASTYYYATLFPQLPEPDQKNPPYHTYRLEQQMAPVEFKDGRAGFEKIMAPATGAVGGDTGGFPAGPGLGRGREAPGIEGPGMGGGASIAKLWQKTPTAEEIWLAQEDFSIKYDLLQVVRRTVDRVARLDPFEVKTPLPENTLKAVGFRNDRWEVVLYLERERGKDFISKKSTIKNVSPRVLLLSNPRTRGPLVFQLRQGPNAYPLRLKGEPLAAGAQTEFAVVGEQFSVDLINLQNPVEMAQFFDWSASPVRRIDDIRLGYNSHRTSNLPLIASKHFPPPEPAEGEAAPEMSSDSMMGGMPGAGGGAAGPPTTTGENGLVKNRYVHVTGQARSMPVALTVIIDQTHLHEFLTELLNCQLRFQITQVQVRHVRDVASQLEALPAAGTGTPMGGTPMIGGRPPIMGPGTGLEPGAGAAGSPLDPNLVELTVYGMTTLYEKFSMPREDAPDAPMGMNPTP